MSAKPEVELIFIFVLYGKKRFNVITVKNTIWTQKKSDRKPTMGFRLAL